MLTPDIQKAFGEGYIVCDEDIVYLVADRWMLALLQPTDLITPEMLTWLRGLETRKGLILPKWEILTAKAIELGNQKFLPHRARKYQDVLTEYSWYTEKFSSERCRNLFKAWTTDNCVSLSAMFHGGYAHPIYKTEKKKFAREPSLQQVHFRFDQKLVAVDGARLLSADEMGLEVFCPKDHSLTSARDGDIPPLVLRGGNILGFMMPEASSGVLTDPHGRSLYKDAAALSWRSDNTDYQGLTSTDCYPVGKNYRLGLWELVELEWNFSSLKSAVGSMRWKGLSDEEIESIYESRRADAYEETYAKLLQWADREAGRLRQLQAGANTTDWQWGNAKSEVQRLCFQFENLSSAWGRDLDLGRLPEAVRLLGENA